MSIPASTAAYRMSIQSAPIRSTLETPKAQGHFLILVSVWTVMRAGDDAHGIDAGTFISVSGTERHLNLQLATPNSMISVHSTPL